MTFSWAKSEAPMISRGRDPSRLNASLSFVTVANSPDLARAKARSRRVGGVMAERQRAASTKVGVGPAIVRSAVQSVQRPNTEPVVRGEVFVVQMAGRQHGYALPSRPRVFGQPNQDVRVAPGAARHRPAQSNLLKRVFEGHERETPNLGRPFHFGSDERFWGASTKAIYRR